MSGPLTIVWDRPGVLTSSAGNVRRVTVDEALTDAEAAAAVVDAVKDVDVSSVVGVVPRDRGVWRSVDAPPIPEGELPGVAKLQFAAQVAAAADAYSIDFVSRRTDEGVHLAVVGVPTSIVGVFRAIAERLDVPLSAVRLSSGALADAAPPDVDAVVAAGDATVETVTLSAADGKRTLLDATARRHARGGAEAGEVAATEARRLQLSLSEGAVIGVFGRDVEDCVRIDGRSDPGEIAAAATAGDGRDWNFAAPRQPAAPRDVRRTALIGGLAAATALAVFFGWSLWAHASDLDEEAARLRDQIAASEDFLKAKGKLRGDARDIQRYLGDRPPVGRVIADVIEAMPERERLVFSELQTLPVSSGGVAAVKGTVYGVERQDIERLDAALAAIGYRPKATAISETDERPGYGYRRPLEFVVPRAASGPKAAAADNPEMPPGGSDADA